MTTPYRSRSKKIDPYESMKNRLSGLVLDPSIHREWDEINDIENEQLLSEEGSFGRVLSVVIRGRKYVMKELRYADMLKDVEKYSIDDVVREIEHQSIVHKSPYICPLRGIIVGISSVMLVMDPCGKEYNIQDHFQWRHFGQLCEAIASIHRYGILHLDIKPENTMTDENGNIKLIDFGQSMHVRDIQPKRVGTFGYEAPEVIVESDGHSSIQISPAVDMWELGVTLYTMVTGIPPFGVGTIAEVESRISNAKWNREVLKYANISAYRICENLLVKEPRMRWTIRDVLNYMRNNGLYTPLRAQSRAQSRRRSRGSSRAPSRALSRRMSV